MDCRKFHDELDLRFPSLRLSDKEKVHVEECLSCQHHWQRMQTMAGILGKDDDCFAADSEIEQLIDSVNKRIDDLPSGKHVASFRIGRLLPLAAAVILIVSVGLFSLFVSSDSGNNSVNNEFDSDSFAALLDDPENAELDDKTVEILLNDFTSEHSTNAGELLLDDLTDEEFHFLMDNYDVGELL